MPTLNDGTSSDTLDDMFGEALSPPKMDPIENRLLPRSLHELDSRSSELLRLLMSATERGLGVSRYVYSKIPILWVIDQLGRLWFALEEMVNLADESFLYPSVDRTSFQDLHKAAAACGG
jgi:hypothetical protein